MATADQIKALLKCHVTGDEDLFRSVALQIAAHEATKGNERLAKELRDLLEKLKRPQQPAGSPRAVPITRATGELAGLVTASYPSVRLSDLVLDDEVRHRIDDVKEFKQRISRTEWEDQKRPKSARETRNWVIGEDGRTHGSLHSDWWLGKAVELARCNRIAVYPVTGWWKERHHLGRYERRARYSLIVSIEAPKLAVNFYNPITTYNTVETELMT